MTPFWGQDKDRVLGAGQGQGPAIEVPIPGLWFQRSGVGQPEGSPHLSG